MTGIVSKSQSQARKTRAETAKNLLTSVCTDGHGPLAFDLWVACAGIPALYAQPSAALMAMCGLVAAHASQLLGISTTIRLCVGIFHP